MSASLALPGVNKCKQYVQKSAQEVSQCGGKDEHYTITNDQKHFIQLNTMKDVPRFLHFIQKNRSAV